MGNKDNKKIIHKRKTISRFKNIARIMREAKTKQKFSSIEFVNVKNESAEAPAVLEVLDLAPATAVTKTPLVTATGSLTLPSEQGAATIIVDSGQELIENTPRVQSTSKLSLQTKPCEEINNTEKESSSSPE